MKLERIGKQVIVRPYKKSDYQAWKTAYLSILPKQKNAWDITAQRDESKLKRSDFEKILASQKMNRNDDYFFDFGIFLKDGTLIGGVSIMDISRQVFQNAYLGYRIFNNYWGKGYGKEGVRLGIDIAFKDLKLHRIEAGIEPNNRRSLNLAKSLKMRREGVKKRALFLRNKWVDLVMYTLTSEDVGRKFNTNSLVLKRRM